MALRLLVVMDPPSTVLVDADTSFALMEAAEARGHRVDHALITDLCAEVEPASGQRRAGVRSRRARCSRDPSRPPITLLDEERAWLADYDAVLVRKDPPFDANYLWATQVLELARGETLIVNDPRGLREANEKLYALHFPSVMPRTLVSSDRRELLAFLREHGKIVLKPLSGAGGDGVFLVTEGDLNTNAIIETVTTLGRRLAMAQEFLPAVARGDKRVLVLDGEPLGGLLRVPKAGDVRSNIHVGGSVERAPLDADDLRIVEAVRDRLRADGLYFVGLDVIGGKLTEVNVTSPTGIQQMSRFDGVDHSARVVDWIERRVGAGR